MSENKYRFEDEQDEDLSPSFTRSRRSASPHQSSSPPASPKTKATSKEGQAPTGASGRGSRTIPSDGLSAQKPPTAPRRTAPAEQVEDAGEASRKRPAPAPKSVEKAPVEEAATEAPAVEAPKRGAVGKGRRIALLLLVVLALVAGIWLFSKTFLTVREVVVLGQENAVGWTEEQIISTANIALGTPMRRVSEKEIDARISDAFAVLSGAKVVKIFPGRVEITPVSAVPSYRFTYEDTTYVLSAELKVLIEETEEYTGLPELILGDVSTCELGKTVAFAGEYDYDIVLSIMKELNVLLPSENLDRVDISNKFSICILYKSKYKLLFGNRENLAQKVRLALATLDDPGISNGGPVEVDVSSGYKASVKFTENGN